MSSKLQGNKFLAYLTPYLVLRFLLQTWDNLGLKLAEKETEWNTQELKELTSKLSDKEILNQLEEKIFKFNNWCKHTLGPMTSIKDLSSKVLDRRIKNTLHNLQKYHQYKNVINPPTQKQMELIYPGIKTIHKLRFYDNYQCIGCNGKCFIGNLEEHLDHEEHLRLSTPKREILIKKFYKRIGFTNQNFFHILFLNPFDEKVGKCMVCDEIFKVNEFSTHFESKKHNEMITKDRNIRSQTYCHLKIIQPVKLKKVYSHIYPNQIMQQISKLEMPFQVPRTIQAISETSVRCLVCGFFVDEDVLIQDHVKNHVDCLSTKTIEDLRLMHSAFDGLKNSYQLHSVLMYPQFRKLLCVVCDCEVEFSNLELHLNLESHTTNAHYCTLKNYDWSETEEVIQHVEVFNELKETLTIKDDPTRIVKSEKVNNHNSIRGKKSSAPNPSASAISGNIF